MNIPFTKHTLPNGLDVLIHEDHALPIVAVSGHDYEERVLEIRQAGADDYVRKARLADELPRVLAALLEDARRSARSRS